MLLLLGVCDSCTVTKPGLCQAQKSGQQASRGPNGTHHALKFKETPARGTGSWGPLGTCEEEQGCPLRELESRLSALPAGVHATRAAKAQVQTLPRGFPTSFLYCLTPWVRSQTTGTRIPGGVLRVEPAGSARCLCNRNRCRECTFPPGPPRATSVPSLQRRASHRRRRTFHTSQRTNPAQDQQAASPQKRKAENLAEGRGLAL